MKQLAWQKKSEKATFPLTTNKNAALENGSNAAFSFFNFVQ
jgi:hypothetical protein